MSGPEPTTVPNRRSSSKRGSLVRSVLRLLFLVTLLGVAAVTGYFYHTLHRPLAFEGQSYQVEPGDSLAQFATKLLQEGVIDETLSLRLLGRLSGNSGQLQVGEYRFRDGIDLRRILEQLTLGEGQVQLPFLAVEGSTFTQFRERLREAPELSQTVGTLSDAELMDRLGHPGEHPEGRFYPDTYSYTGGATDLSILHRAYDLMTEKLASAWLGRAKDLPLETPYQALILASIVEKETGVASERPQIAGVFVNRLRRGMLLQTDPTVIYGLGDKFDGNLTRRHLEADTPYNTYTRKGLPPTPIALPGMAAIKAVLHPAATEAIYFVARGDGSHAFSKTLREHNKAVRKYQLNRK